MTDLSRFVRRTAFAASPREILQMPPTVVHGVTEAAAVEIKRLQIYSVFDLAVSGIFRNARLIAGVGDKDLTLSRFGRAAADMVDNAEIDRSLAELAEADIEHLDGIGSRIGPKIKAALGTETIREFALWPPHQLARTLVQETLVPEPMSANDPEAPADLIPATGEYPTEKVFFNSVFIDKIDGTGMRDLEGPIDLTTFGADNPGFSKPATGAIVRTEQAWYAEGVALGSLLHSVALAPGESTRIAMVDWSRRTTGTTDQETTQTEELENTTERNRSIAEVTGAVAEETQTGSSRTTSAGYSANTGFGFGLFLPGAGQGGAAGGGLTGGQATAVSTSAGKRNLSAELNQDITDRTFQKANSVRNRRATVVSEVNQTEQETLTTRTVTNYNHMHALSIQYYEIVQIYKIKTRVSKVDKCLFIPFATFPEWTPDLIARHRGQLISALPAGRLRQALIDGAELVSIARLSRPPHERFAANYTEKLNSLLTAAREITGHPVAESAFENWRLPSEVKILGLNLEFRTEMKIELIRIRLRDGNIQTIEATEKKDTTQTNLNQPLALHEIESIEFDSTDIALKIKEYGRSPDTWLWYASMFGILIICTLKLRFGSHDFDHAVVGQTPSANDYEAGAFEGFLTEVRDPEWDEGPGRTAFRFTLKYPILNFSKVGLGVGDALISHLNQNTALYSQFLWLAMGGAQLSFALAHYKYNGRPLLEQIDPIPVAVTGNYVGFRMNADSETDDDWKKWLKDHGYHGDEGQLKPVSSEATIPLPSGGVFAEAVLGRFNSAEKLDISRFWNWQDSPIPFAAPQIAALQAGGKTQQIDPATGTLAPPVAQQSAPAPLPDPQLSAILNVLGTANLFRDQSGLGELANLTGAALQAAATAATAAAGQAGSNMEVVAKYSNEAFQKLLQLAAKLPGKGGGGGGGGLPPGAAFTPTDRNALISELMKSAPGDLTSFGGSQGNAIRQTIGRLLGVEGGGTDGTGGGTDGTTFAGVGSGGSPPVTLWISAPDSLSRLPGILKEATPGKWFVNGELRREITPGEVYQSLMVLTPLAGQLLYFDEADRGIYLTDYNTFFNNLVPVRAFATGGARALWLEQVARVEFELMIGAIFGVPEIIAIRTLALVQAMNMHPEESALLVEHFPKLLAHLLWFYRTFPKAAECLFEASLLEVFRNLTSVTLGPEKWAYLLGRFLKASIASETAKNVALYLAIAFRRATLAFTTFTALPAAAEDALAANADELRNGMIAEGIPISEECATTILRDLKNADNKQEVISKLTELSSHAETLVPIVKKLFLDSRANLL